MKILIGFKFNITSRLIGIINLPRSLNSIMIIDFVNYLTDNLKRATFYHNSLRFIIVNLTIIF